MVDITRKLKQTCVHWVKATRQGDGTMSHNVGVEVKCLWLGSDKLYKNSSGKEVAADAQVFLAAEVATEDLLYFGALADLTVSQQSNPKSLLTSYEVLEFRKLPSLVHQTNFVKSAYLRKRSNNG
jgi:hypothetical protein